MKLLDWLAATRPRAAGLTVLAMGMAVLRWLVFRQMWAAEDASNGQPTGSPTLPTL